jgi:O-antigen biosynthesis protein
MPKILLTNHHLVNYAGSELVTLDLANEFQQKEWDVTVATFRLGGSIARKFSELGIKTVNVLNKTTSENEFDLVWSHHYPVLIKCLVEDCKKTKFLILSSLSTVEPLEAIPFFRSQSDLILCNSDATKKEIINSNNDSSLNTNKILVFPNSVPQKWFNHSLDRNHPSKEVLEAIDILRFKNIDVDLIGLSGITKLVDIDLLGSYDAIITIGRTVQHSMALGIPVFCYDHFGGPGWLTPDNFKVAESFHYSGKCCYQKFQSEQIVNHLINGFSESKTYLSFFRNYAFENYSLTKNIDMVLNSINISNIESKDYISLNSEKLIGKVGKAYWSTLNEREILQQELELSQSQLFQIQTELERSQSQLSQSQIELERWRNTVTAMESSKFWKLRQLWFNFQKSIKRL